MRDICDDLDEPSSEEDSEMVDTESEEDESEEEESEELTSGGMKQNKLDMTDEKLPLQIWTALGKLDNNRPFAFGSSSATLPNPGLFFDDRGVIGLPLSSADAEFLIFKAKRSPYGKGEETITDTEVRNSWELSATEFTVKNPAWDSALNTLISSVHMSLDLIWGPGHVKAELYKLLIYEPGAFFRPHKDSEKAPGMFGTLIVCLPSPHKGGKLTFEHLDRTYEFETDIHSEFGTSFAAWYSDITHEVLPVTSGYRLVLTYNLVQKATVHHTAIPAMPLGRQAELLALLETYDSQLREEDNSLPEYLIHRLEHKYTQFGIEKNALKGSDAKHVSALIDAAKKLDFAIYLAFTELKIVNDDDDFFENRGEEIEREFTLTEVFRLDGSPFAENVLADEFNVIQPEDIAKGDPDDEEDSGWTGNEGATATYWYRDTALLLVPPSRKIDFVVLCQRTNESILPVLRESRPNAANDPAMHLQVDHLCELALKNMDTATWKSLNPDTPDYSLVNEVALATLETNQFNLFEKLCVKRGGVVALRHAEVLGHTVARVGRNNMTAVLKKGAPAADTSAKKQKYLTDLVQGFQSYTPSPSSEDVTKFKDWAERIIFDDFTSTTGIRQSEVQNLVGASKSINWPLFESIVRDRLLSSTVVVQVMFVNTFVSLHEDDLSEDQRKFLMGVFSHIWDNFTFVTSLTPSSLTQSGYSSFPLPATVTREKLDGADLATAIGHSLNLLPSYTLSNHIIPAILAAVPGADAECAAGTFVEFVHSVVKNKVAEFQLSKDPDAEPPAIHKTLVQSLLAYLILKNFWHEPAAPQDWKLQKSGCGCADCKVVDNFLASPTQTVLEHRCAEQRRKHLSNQFKYTNNPPEINVEVIEKRPIPYTWQATKHRDKYERAKSAWSQARRRTHDAMKSLIHPKTPGSTLKRYLGMHYQTYMDLAIDLLPELGEWSKDPPVPEMSGNIRGGGDNAGRKRLPTHDWSAENSGPSKKTKLNESNEEEEVIVID